MGEKGRVCINGDDDMLRTVKTVRGEKPLTFGLEQENDVYAVNVENKGLFGSSADIHMEIMKLLTGFARGDRYANLNKLMEESYGRDPISE